MTNSKANIIKINICITEQQKEFIDGVKKRKYVSTSSFIRNLIDDAIENDKNIS
jgi:Arc/MetJ-type ribon-helix-helix transcriptional regulator